MNKLILYKCETPLHVGSGTELGVVDMPIQREIHTGFPKVEASGIKGAFRNDFSSSSEEDIKTCTNIFFGNENEDKDAHAGSLEFTDARILLFPVKSARGIFAWITCPFVINRFISDLSINGINKIAIDDVGEKIKPLEDEAIILSENESNIILNYENDKYILLEEFGYRASNHKNIFDSLIENMKHEDSEKKDKSCANEDYIVDKLSKDIVVVNDEAFSYFVNMSTEVNTRIKIGVNGVVKDGHLFTEEYVPEETIMYNFIDINDDSLKIYINDDSLKDEDIKSKWTGYLDSKKYLQLGGNSTLGKGIVSVNPI